MVNSLNSDLVLEICGGEWLQKGDLGDLDTIAIDSRKVLDPEHTLFVALEGLKSDGHDFLEGLLARGLTAAVVQRGRLDKALLTKFPRASIIEVPDTLIALQALARHQRGLFKGTVVGITGSNGKTIVKEWAAQILGRNFSTAKSPKSYNSQIGVPLSIFEIQTKNKVAVLEAGISRIEEMQRLSDMILPHIGLFTNLGTAHEEGFDHSQQKLEEKVRLFQSCTLLIYRKEQVNVDNYLRAVFAPERLISWSDEPGADYTLSIKKDLRKTKIILVNPGLGLYTFHTRFKDEASLENLRHVIVLCLTLGMKEAEIQQGIDQLKGVDMRLTLKQGANGCLIIDDTYNNDLAGLRLAMDFMQQQRPKRSRVLILSDMLQVGDQSLVYQEVSRLIQHYGFDSVLAVGDKITVLDQFYRGKISFFKNTEDLLSFLTPNPFENDLILITGARMYAFEKVVNKLQQQIHGTVLEINLNALSHNFNFFKSKLKPSTKVMVMVKAFAYGGGATEIANHLQQLQADYLTVAYTDEGLTLRQQGIELPIMVLNPLEESFQNLMDHQLEPVVYSLGFLEKLGKFCKAHEWQITIHLDLDTGMRRLGFEKDEIEALLLLLHQHPYLHVGSVYTHLVAADEAEQEVFTREQVDRFDQMAEQILNGLSYKPLKHVLNSPGIIRYPEYQYDMVRLGIGLYGIEVNGWYDHQLQPISILKTTVSQVKQLKKGESIGYGRKGVMPVDGEIATIAIGYADGYDRRFSNGKGKIQINGQVAPVIGNICMDMCMVDVTGLGVKEGDEATVYGPHSSLKEMAETIGTIPYELLTNISSRVKRVYFLD